MQNPNNIFIKSEMHFLKMPELNKVAEHLHHRNAHLSRCYATESCP